MRRVAVLQIIVPVKLNTAPALAGLTADSESPQLLGTTVTWTAQASDPESDPISYRFLVNDTPATDWQSENLWAWIAMQPGTSQISVQVKDSLHEGPQGEAGNMSREFSINAPVAVLAEIVPVKLNESPILTGLTADSESPQLLGTTVTWTAQASDPESDPISYRFLVNDTPATDWQSENLWAWIAMQPGTSQISVQVKDSLHEGPQGEAGNMSREFSINAPVAVLAEIVPVKLNESPALSGLTADIESPQLLGTTVTWTAQASDPESDPISYRFLVNDTPATDWQSENLWAWTAIQPGTSQISVQVKDSLHEGPQGEAGNMSREFSRNEPVAVKPVTGENVTVPEENKTGPATTVPESVIPPVTENITTPIVPENVTQQKPANETEAVTIAPETVVPPEERA